MGAVSSVTQLLATGDHIVCGNNVYSGTTYYFDMVAARLGITYDAVNATNLDNIRDAIKPNTRVNQMIQNQIKERVFNNYFSYFS